MKRGDPPMRPSEDESQTAETAQRADITQLEHRLRETQGGADPDNPRVGDLLSECRHAWILGKDRPMATKSHPHVYMEMLEEGTHTLQELAEMRHTEMAGMAMGKQPQRLLPSCHSFMQRVATDEKLRRAGYPSLRDYYVKLHPC